MAVAVGYPTTSYRDRTAELYSIANNLGFRAQVLSSLPNGSSSAVNRSLSPGIGDPQQGPRPAGLVLSEFNSRASRIGLSIHSTSQKLSRLTKLAKRTSMFDDPAAEIQALTSVIKEDITSLNGAIADLQAFCDARNESVSGITRHSNEHSSTVVGNLKTRLMDATKEFKDVLTLRTENLKVHESRRQIFTASPLKDINSPLNTALPFANSNGNAFRKRGAIGNGNADGSTSASGVSTSSDLTNLAWANGASPNTQLFTRGRSGNSGGANQGTLQGQMQQQQQQLIHQPVQDNYLHSRADAIQNVESTIGELSNIFTQLAGMVAQQGELAIRIDENMEESLANVEGAQGALLKHLNTISSNRWLILKIFFVLVVFMLIFVVFIA